MPDDTFSMRTTDGPSSRMSRSCSNQRLLRGSEKPSPLPAREIPWQGKPPHSTSTGTRSLDVSFDTSPWQGTPGKFFSSTLRQNGSISACQTTSPRPAQDRPSSKPPMPENRPPMVRRTPPTITPPILRNKPLPTPRHHQPHRPALSRETARIRAKTPPCRRTRGSSTGSARPEAGAPGATKPPPPRAPRPSRHPREVSTQQSKDRVDDRAPTVALPHHCSAATARDHESPTPHRTLAEGTKSRAATTSTGEDRTSRGCSNARVAWWEKMGFRKKESNGVVEGVR